MTALTLMITRAGQARFTAAQLDADINLGIASVGLTDAPFVSAPTLTVLPGEFKRLTSISGDQVGDNIVHLTIRDDSADTFYARGFGLFLADGTLFATYAQPTRIFEKSARATFLAAIDIAFPTGDVSELRFGNTDFLNPPATTARKGVVRLAARAEADAGTDTGTAITPADLRRALPIGTVTMWYGSVATVPAGWAICDGRQVDRSDGAGRIATPDLRGRAPIGAGGSFVPGTQVGAGEKRIETSRDGAHIHGITGTAGQVATGVTLATTQSTEVANGGSGNNVRTATLTDPGHAHGVTGTTTEVGAHTHTATVDVMQPSLALLFIMKV